MPRARLLGGGLFVDKVAVARRSSVPASSTGGVSHTRVQRAARGWSGWRGLRAALMPEAGHTGGAAVRGRTLA